VKGLEAWIMTRRALRSLLHLSAAVLGCLIVVAGARPSRAVAQAPPPPIDVALGDSIEFGLGDNILADGIGYTPLFQAFLSTAFQRPVQLLNLGVPFATTRDIWQDQR
jgi:hypothetical protein